MWRPDLDGKSGPIYRQIADAISYGISSGNLSVGDRLPAQRDLAYDLGVSLNTVSRAYSDATDRGFLQGEVGRGTYVRAVGPLAPDIGSADMIRQETGPIDFSLNLPAQGKAADALALTLSELKGTNHLAAYLDYQTIGDHVRHAKAAATWLGGVGLEVESDNVVLTSGAQHGLMVAMLATMRPGDVLLTEELTYGPVKALAQHLGLKIMPVAIDDGGMMADALDAVCRNVSAKILYCLPTLHTPTTATMDEDRRAEIVSVARTHDLLIIEDDVFGALPSERPGPVASIAPERTIYVTSVSKSLAPGLRVGYLHAPAPYIGALRAAVNLSCWMPPPLMAEIASRWIENGTADKLNDFQRSEATHRQTLAKQILPDKHLKSHPNGFHIWLTLPSNWRPDAFRMAAEQRGVKVLTGEMFSVGHTSIPPAVRLCISHEPSRHRVTTGLETVAALLKEATDPGALVL